MAKLHARGRRELARVKKSHTPKDPEAVVSITEFRALMTDRRILQRFVYLFPAGPYDSGKPQRHDYGWKVWGKLKPGHSASDPSVVEAWCSDYEKMGWERQFVRDGGW